MRTVHFITLTMVVVLAAVGKAAELSPVGEWRWFTKTTVTIKADGTVTESKGHRGIWKWTDATAGELKIIWERTTDTLKLSSDASTAMESHPSRALARRRSKFGGDFDQDTTLKAPMAHENPQYLPCTVIGIDPSTYHYGQAVALH